MFVIYSNENNPFTLKLLIAANLAGKSFDLKIVNLRDASIPEPKHLPCLQHEDRSLFMSNAAAYYLLPPGSSHESIVDLWLEWESAVLAPTLLANFATAGKGQSSKSALKTSLKTLNDAVGSNLSLTAEDLSVCDVVIWSTLYPFYKDTNLSKEHFTDLDNLKNWFQKLESKPEFQKSITQYKVNPGSTSYQVLSISTKLILGQPTASISSSNSVLSPQHSSSGDTVTSEEIEAARSAWENGGSALPKVKADKALVLPVPGEKNILITSALPYVNNVPHLGNIIGCVLSADVFARFNRLCNHNTLYVCGTDEYGTATETKALEENLTPQQICDKYFEVHNSIYRWFNIGFDYFGRTTTPEQTQITQEIFLQLNRNGFMQTQLVDQLLCEKCNRYLADRFVEGGCPHPGCNYEDARGDQCDGCGKLVNATELKNPRCKACSTPPVGRKSSQFFLDLPKLEPLLRHWMNKSSPGWSNNARIIANSWMKEGLKPRCITRDLKWGIPVPIEGYTDKVFYVWFDAPIGYLSISARYTKEWKQWWKPAPNTSVELYQFMAKDNVPFHSVMFPAALLGLNDGYTTVSHIMATEYLNYEDGKFSKSRGIGVFGNDAQSTGIPSDVWRFYLLYVRPENQDSSFSWIDLATKTNSELLNNLGNFVNRAQVFAEKFFDGVVPKMVLDNDDYSFLALCTRELREFTSSLSKAKLRDGIRHILSISRHGNIYMQSSAPWVLIKGSEKEKEKAGTVIGLCCNITCLLTTLLFPYMPETSRILKTQLNAPPGVSVLIPENPVIVNLLPAGHKLGKPSPLFSKIEAAKVEELKKQFAGKQQPLPNNNSKIDSSQTAANPPQQQNGVVDPQEVEKLKIDVDKQALLVKNLKDGGAARTEWQPHLEVLLNLKNKLALLTGEPQTQQKKKKGKK